MTRACWTTDAQRKWLESRLPDWNTAQASTDTKRFRAKIFDDWHQAFPMDPPTAEEIAEEKGDEQLALVTKKQAAEGRVYQWYFNHTRVSSGKRDTINLQKAKRVPALWQIYQSLYYKDKLKVIVDAAWAEYLDKSTESQSGDKDTTKKRERLKIQNQVVMAEYAKETEEVKAKVLRRREELKNAHDGKGGNPEDLQQGISRLVATLKGCISTLQRETGWAFTIFAGGPTPRQGGKITTVIMNSEVEDDDEDFQAHVGEGRWQDIIKLWDAFLHDLYPEDTCLARALSDFKTPEPREHTVPPEEHSPSTRNKKASTSKHVESDYELQKKANIARNQAVLAKLFEEHAHLLLVKPGGSKAGKTGGSNKGRPRRKGKGRLSPEEVISEPEAEVAAPPSATQSQGIDSPGHSSSSSTAVPTALSGGPSATGSPSAATSSPTASSSASELVPPPLPPTTTLVTPDPTQNSTQDPGVGVDTEVSKTNATTPASEETSKGNTTVTTPVLEETASKGDATATTPVPEETARKGGAMAITPHAEALPDTTATSTAPHRDADTLSNASAAAPATPNLETAPNDTTTTTTTPPSKSTPDTSTTTATTETTPDTTSTTTSNTETVINPTSVMTPNTDTGTVLNTTRTTTPMDLTSSPTNEGIPTHSATVSATSGMPLFVREGESFFRAVGALSSAWGDLIDKWISFERQSQYRGNLPTAKRPPQIGWWLKRHRKFTNVPNIIIGEYAEAFREWWTLMQPPERTTSGNWPLLKVGLGEMDRLVVLDRSGQNGIFLVMLGLSWWAGHVTAPALLPEFETMVEDVDWVLSMLIFSFQTRLKHSNATEDDDEGPPRKRLHTSS